MNQKKKAKYYDDGMHAKTNTASGAVATYYYPQGFPEPTGTAIPHNYPFISQVGHNNDDGGHARMQVFLDVRTHGQSNAARCSFHNSPVCVSSLPCSLGYQSLCCPEPHVAAFISFSDQSSPA